MFQIRSYQDSGRTESAAKAKNFLKILQDKAVVLFLHFLSDVVTVLSKLSLILQTRETTVAEVVSKLEATKEILILYKNTDGSHLKKIRGKDTFAGHPLKGSDKGFEQAKGKLLYKLVHCLSERFDKDAEVFHAMAIANLKTWPRKHQDEPEFGCEHVETLADMFQDCFEDSDCLLEQWVSLKTMVYTRFKNVNSNVTWAQINSSFKKDCPEILKLIDLILCLPASSSEAERGFSLMKVTKTDWRSNLSDSSLSDLMCVNLHTPGVGQSFDPMPGIDQWLSNKRRKPVILRKKRKKHFDNEADSSDDPESECELVISDDDQSDTDIYSGDSDSEEEPQEEESKQYSNLLEYESDQDDSS